MKKSFLFFLAMFFFTAKAEAAEAPEASLFFTHDEVQAVETLAAKTLRSASNNGDIHLGAVLYYGPDHWVLWLQNRQWTPATHDPNVRVISVAPDEIHLNLISAPGMAMRDVSLKPHQTLQLSTGRVIEGSFEAPSSETLSSSPSR